MRRFRLYRYEDISGVSGTGVVATGVYWTETGYAVLHWAGEYPTVTSLAGGIDAVLKIHGHHGATAVEWIDDEDGYPL